MTVADRFPAGKAAAAVIGVAGENGRLRERLLALRFGGLGLEVHVFP
jgi:hypothetical protein